MARNILTALRDLVPLHRLSTSEALHVAEQQANCLLRLSGVSAPPVEERIISHLDIIQVERVQSTEASAASQWSQERWLILLNATETPSRQLLSLAHEFKHVLDNPFVTILYHERCGSHSIQLAEQACDYFALCLLMPRRWIRAAWNEGVRDVAALSRRFGVSPQAIRVRLLQAELIEATHPCLITEA
jgi:Zn-dependent peptidase ImmA (M78 family)